MKVTRRNHLAAMGGALLAANPLTASAKANDRRDDDDAEVLYAHGQVWNRELAGVAGELRLAFDFRVNLETGAGFGAAGDSVFPDWNVHFSIDSTERKRLRSGESRFTMTGVVTQAVNPAMVGQPVKILAETRRDATAVAIKVGDLAFAGAGLVVIAIIAILISLLLPAVQSAR
jgi:hypothetical protein